MTSRGYFGKMNSTLGSVVPLAMFNVCIPQRKHKTKISKFFLTGIVANKLANLAN